MIGIVVALAISWLLLYIIQRKSILALGVTPILKRLQQFTIGFFFTAILCLGHQIFLKIIKSAQWLLNDDISGTQILNMFVWDLKSVLTEELIFRGAILYLLIKKIGIFKGTLISAICFGIYHWFSYGIFGNIMPMIVIFIGTGIMGYAWALAFAKTESMAMPIGLHLGWNFTFNTIFSNGPLGKGILIVENNSLISDWYNLIGLWVVPLIVMIVIKYSLPTENIEFKQI